MELCGQLSIDLAQNLVAALTFTETVKRLRQLVLQFRNRIIGGLLPALWFSAGAHHRILELCAVDSSNDTMRCDTYLQHRHFIYMH
jgi:hypothetical protein